MKKNKETKTVQCTRCNGVGKVESGCYYAPLVYMKKGEARQTDNGFLIARIKGWYCPICSGSYGDF